MLVDVDVDDVVDVVDGVVVGSVGGDVAVVSSLRRKKKTYLNNTNNKINRKTKT